MITGTITAVLILAFLGLFAWAYSPGRRQRFEEAAALPLVDDTAQKEPSK
jgi:cytochrome c oxidase cbb3-type subunit 4